MITKLPTLKFSKEYNKWIEIINLKSELIPDLNLINKIDIGTLNILVPLPLKSI